MLMIYSRQMHRLLKLHERSFERPASELMLQKGSFIHPYANAWTWNDGRKTSL
jgi:hypothetical protein